MSSRRSPLTPELHVQIAAAIRAGGYPHIAAQAFGVPGPLWSAWLRRGLTAAAREPYRSLALDVQRAGAQARLKAEVDVLQGEPRWWLEHGRGRDCTDNAGWSSAVKPVADSTGPRNGLLDPEVIAAFQRLQELLAPYPEACGHAAQLLAESGAARAA